MFGSRALKITVGCVLAQCTFSADAFAQAAQLAAVEGYAFHAETLKPLRNVRIQVLLTEGSGASGVSAITDANGFYSLTFEPFPALTAIEGSAGFTGRGGNGVTSKFFPLYFPVRTTIYQRNVYLTPPRGSTRCY